MKTRAAALAGLTLLMLASPAGAGPHHRHGWYPAGPHHFHAPLPMRHVAPWGWGIAGVALGTVIYTTITPPVVAAPVVVAPAPRPPKRIAYYCEHWQAWYPQIAYCPEGWRAVPAW